MDLSSLGAATSAVWTRRLAARAGLSTSAIDRKLRTEWQSPYPGVLADAGYDLDPVQWATAGVLASGGEGCALPLGPATRTGELSVSLPAIPCGRDAARLWGFPLIDDDDPATGGLDKFEHDVHVWGRGDDLTAPVVKGQPRAHVLHRHSLTFYEGEIVQHDSGLWVPSPLRTALDCCVLLPFEAAVCVMDNGLQRTQFTEADLAAALALRAGHAGVALQQAVVAAADGRSEAPTETLLRLLLKPDWPDLEPQVTLYDERGVPLRRYDLGDRAIRFGGEADGKIAHAGSLMAARDHAKDRLGRAFGWSTERATWFDVRRQQEATRTRFLAARDRLRKKAA